MRRTWQIACKELLQNRRDGLAALFTILLPVIFTVFLGLIIGGAVTETVPLGVLDADRSPFSRVLVERLEASPLLRVDARVLGQSSTIIHRQSLSEL